MLNKLKLDVINKNARRSEQFRSLDRNQIKRVPYQLNVHTVNLRQSFPRKPIKTVKFRSEGSSKQKDIQIPAIENHYFKRAVILPKQNQYLQKSQKRSKQKSVYLNANKFFIKKVRKETQIIQQKQKVQFPTNNALKKISKISPDKELKFSSRDKIVFSDDVQTETKGFKKKSEIKLTVLERQEIVKYQTFYIGKRRISSKYEFTAEDGEPKIVVGDGIAYRYQILSQLGRGSFGKVFKAYDHKKNQTVALKIIKSQLKFIKQAKVQVQILEAAIINDPKLHTNLVRMKSSFIFRGHSCITFQLLHKNLYQLLKINNFNGLDLDTIRKFAIQILHCLFFLHKHKIIHCDLKPQNIMLKQANKNGIRIIDVGSGCYQHKQIYTYIQSRFYRAPQIILGIRYTGAIDMWSFGCILVQLFTGFPIFPGQDENQQMLMFMQVLGKPSVSLLQKASRRHKFFDEDFKCIIPQQQHNPRIPNTVNLRDLVGTYDQAFINLLRKCFQWDPTKRLTAQQGLLDEWILNGLPSQIRQQHITKISKYFMQ